MPVGSAPFPRSGAPALPGYLISRNQTAQIPQITIIINVHSTLPSGPMAPPRHPLPPRGAGIHPRRKKNGANPLPLALVHPRKSLLSFCNLSLQCNLHFIRRLAFHPPPQTCGH
jgi:hypothetical protein